MSDMTIELPELGLFAEHTRPAEQELALVGVRRRGSPEAPPEIRSRLSLGGPDPTRMKTRADEPREIADRRDGADFWSVMMSLTFEPVEPEAMESAWLRIDLEADGDGPAPIAFAMDPGRKEEGVQTELSGGVEANAKVVKLSGGAKRSFTLHEAEILALRRLQSDPAWEVYPSSGRPLRGQTDFELVVKAPAGTRGRGRATFGAEITWTSGTFIRRTHEVTWEPQAAIEFELP
jgi:hypothetical protein